MVVRQHFAPSHDTVARGVAGSPTAANHSHTRVASWELLGADSDLRTACGNTEGMAVIRESATPDGMPT